VLQTAWLGLVEVAGIAVEGSKAGGRLDLSWPDTARDDPGAAAIVLTAARAIERLALQFPDHVGINRERADGRCSAPPPKMAAMSDVYKPITPEPEPQAAPPSEAGRAILAGVLGGIASAAGYIVYSRLNDDQRSRVNAQARSLVEGRINELRSRFGL